MCVPVVIGHLTKVFPVHVLVALSASVTSDWREGNQCVGKTDVLMWILDEDLFLLSYTHNSIVFFVFPFCPKI